MPVTSRSPDSERRGVRRRRAAATARAEAPANAGTGPPAERVDRSLAGGRGLIRGALALFAMAGWRLEHLNLAWIGGGAASVGLAHVLIGRADWRLTFPYFVATLAFYYGGNAAVLLSGLPSRWVARLGEERAFRRYETLAGLMFLNQGLGVGCMSALHLPRLEAAVPTWITIGLGVVLFAAGLLVKLWATLTAGVDIYYFRDMFLRRPLAPRSLGGPYRFLRNPMYSLGQLQGYGYALLFVSIPGVLAAAAGHLLIYAFYLVAERPFVRQTYAPHACPVPQPESTR